MAISFPSGFNNTSIYNSALFNPPVAFTFETTFESFAGTDGIISQQDVLDKVIEAAQAYYKSSSLPWWNGATAKPEDNLNRSVITDIFRPWGRPFLSTSLKDVPYTFDIHNQSGMMMHIKITLGQYAKHIYEAMRLAAGGKGPADGVDKTAFDAFIASGPAGDKRAVGGPWDPEAN